MNNFHMREGKVEFRWKRWRNKKRQEVSSCLMVLFSGAVLLGAGGVALAGPTGGQVTGGQGTITNPNGTTTNINQQSNVLNINWQDFSIQQGETVNFYQPGSTSVAINRVVGGVPSYLAGALNANGRVFILNSAGITFTGTSQVNVGALLATTAMTVNGDPTQAASYSGSGYGAVINQGSISVSNGGFAILAAPYVQNTGFIKADLGTIALAGTNQFTLDLSGTGLINFVVPAGAVEKIVSDGKAVGVDNAGTLQARSGQVLISANVASEVINAVVNLNGIVDADAFAANGQGGAVLVTAAGDINVGGQVTAKGSGAGNGGQILTKAAGNDVIGSMAYVSAAGGTAGGKGGHIEVSGKLVGLHGTIDPGKGGSLLIDPTNIIVVSGGGTGQVANGADSHIGSDFIEDQLRNGVNVTLDASHNIFFETLADDHQLVGGSGNFDIIAGDGNVLGGNITFQGTNDAIIQGAGFIHMNANGGNIGSSGHAMTLITGRSNTLAGTGVNQAGDIVLVAGGDIHVHNVRILSTGSNSHLTANFQANAGHDFVASGDVNLFVNAHGPDVQTATASVNILAHNNINLRNVSAQALAFQRNSGAASDISANAFLTLNAENGNVATRNLLAVASAFNAGDGAAARANALANIHASEDADINGTLNVLGAAVETGQGDSALVNAEALIVADRGHVNVAHDIIVDGIAKSASSSAHVNALASIQANSNLTVNGNVVVHATGSGINDAACNAVAFASAHLLANTNIQINHDINVAAFGRTFGTSIGATGSAIANAQVDVVADNIDIGGNVGANAKAIMSGNDDGASSAIAQADLVLDATVGHVNVGRDVIVIADALQDGSSHASANAQANIFANTDVTINGNVGVLASANAVGGNASNANAVANLQIDASHGTLRINHGVTINAIIHDGGTGSPRALAQGNLFALNNVIVGGDISLTASGDKDSSQDGLRVCANLQIDGSHGSVNIGGVNARAIAHSSGSSSAHANAQVNIFANTKIVVTHNLTVSANAQQDNSSSGTGAQACANLQLNAATGSVNVGGNVEVLAVAHAEGTTTAGGNAQANILAHTSIRVGGDVILSANAAETSASGNGVRTSANLLMNAVTGSVNVGGNIDVAAISNEAGPSSARANALVNVLANTNIRVGKDVILTANARQSASGVSSALACANLQLDALTGSVNIGRDVAIDALAIEHGGSSAQARASANILAHTRLVVAGNVHATATADHQGSNGLFARANANLALTAATGSINIGRNVGALANAVEVGSSFAEANAFVNLTANNGLRVGGDVNAIALANVGSSGSWAHANAEINLHAAANNINVNGGVKASANALNIGSESAIGTAYVNLLAGNDVIVNGIVTANAHAEASSTVGFNGALANALVNIHADPITLGGIVDNATASSHADHYANAVANILVAAIGNVTVTGDVEQRAAAFQTNTSGEWAHANANMLLQPGGGANLTIGGDVNANATAHAAGDAPGTAQANVLVMLVGQDVNVNGDIGVFADASQNNSAGDEALANANLQIHPPHNLHIGGDVSVSASAIAFGNAPGFANAQALASLTPAANASIGGDFSVAANANQVNVNGEQAFANANLQLHGSHVHVFGTVDVDATAVSEGKNLGFAWANALADVTAINNASLNGIEVTANANQVSNVGDEAFASANLQLHAGNIHVNGTVDVSASAVSKGNNPGFAWANALASITAGTHLASLNDVNVTANANQVSPSGDEAFANAVLQLHGGRLNVIGTVDVSADAIAFGNKLSKFADANALASITAINNASFNGIEVSANANQVSLSGDEAFANAVLQLHAGNVHVTHNVNVDASAIAFGNNSAKFAYANAFASITAVNNANFSNIDITAEANQVSNSGQEAFANADLQLHAGNVHVTGSLDVEASAIAFGNNGAKFAYANAFASITAANNASLNDVDITANANQVSHSGQEAFANADLQLHAGNVHVSGSLDVAASAIAFGNNSAKFAYANAFASITAANNVNLDDVHITASANQVSQSGQEAFANAVLQIHGGNVHVSGSASVEASALAFGNAIGLAYANALASITAANNVTLNDIDVTALANQVSSNGDQAFANANLQIHAGNVDVIGTVDVNASAIAFGKNSGFAYANALASITAGSHNASFNGIEVTADANQVSTHGAGALANANLQLHANSNIHVTGTIDDHATAVAFGQNVGNASAFANVNLTAGKDITLGGINETADASERNANGQSARANASLHVLAQNELKVFNDIDVSATADNSGNHGNAQALANVALLALGGASNAVDLGDINVFANALDHNGIGLTLANAQVQIVDQNASHGGVHLHSMDVVATANEVAGTAAAHANASANALINAHDVVNANGDDVLVVANAFDGSNAFANAHLAVNAGRVSLGNGGTEDSDIILGSVGAKARATADANTACAHAIASVDINAFTGNASVHGDLIGSAIANYGKVGGNANGQIDATANVHVNAINQNIFVEDVNVFADAENWGDNSARGLAILHLNAHNSINIDGKVFVNALADDHSNAASGATFAASANAQAHFNALAVRTEDSSNSIEVRAHALNAGHKTGKATGVIDFGPATLVNVGGLTMDILVDNSGSHGTNAIANGQLVQTSPTVNWVIGTHGINVHVVASSEGTGGANAHALVNVNQNVINIEGPILVEADAHAGVNATKGALADASLFLHANLFEISGDISVSANADNLGGNRAEALACASINGAASFAFHNLANVTVNAFAHDANANGQTLANAQLKLQANGFDAGYFVDNVTVLAAAIQDSGTVDANAVAFANLDINASGFDANGGITDLAVAVDPHGSNAVASANLLINANFVTIGATHRSLSIAIGGSTTFTASANYGILVGAVAIYEGSNTNSGHGAHALANANLQVTNAGIFGGVDVLALAVDGGGHVADANAHFTAHASESIGIGGEGFVRLKIGGSHGSTLASLSVNEGVLLGAIAIDTGDQGHAHANAVGSITASNNVFVEDGIFDLAVAVTTDGVSAEATANVVVDAQNNVQIDAGHVRLFVSSEEGGGFLDLGGSQLLNQLIHQGSEPGAFSASPAIFAAAAAIELNQASTHHANAHTLVNIDPTNLVITGDVDVLAVAFDINGASAQASANLHLHGSHVGVGTPFSSGSGIFVGAVAIELGNGAANAFACAEVNASGTGDAISLHDVSVVAFGLDLFGNGENVQANAQLQIDAPIGHVELRNLTMLASAFESAGRSSANVIAQANADVVGTSVSVEGNIQVNAIAAGDSEDVLANAFVAIQANYAMNIDGNIVVNAQADGDSNAQGNTWAIADLAVTASSVSSGSVRINGNISVDANALHENNSGAGAAAAYIDIFGSSGVHINGNISLTGEVVTNGVVSGQSNFSVGGFSHAIFTNWDYLTLSIAADNGNVSLHGATRVVANASFGDTNDVERGASAYAYIQTNNGNIGVSGPILVQANAKSAGNSGGTLYVDANVFIGVNDGSGSIAVGDIKVRATASANGANEGQYAIASANIDIEAGSDGGNVVTGFLDAGANARYAGTELYAFANADVFVSANSGSVAIFGARAVAHATGTGSTGTATAEATAHINIQAARNINVSNGGLFADATATVDGIDSASANALIELNAGSHGFGNIFIHGNVLAVAQAFGDHSDDAHANVFLNAANSGSFGNVVVIGNIGAFAYADVIDDQANASVEIFAHNNILIVGNDPIAAAKVGPSNGTTFAFRQAHWTTHDGPNFGSAGSAFAQIIIEAGGSVTVVPASSLTRVEKLYSLPTDELTLNSSGGLTIIPLTIEGQDCGVLGVAGADANMVGKGKACHRKPINVSDLTDSGPL